MKAQLALSGAIDALNQALARVADAAVVLAVVISAVNAMVRYAFDLSSNAWLEIQWYLFAVMVLLGASYTLRVNEHVRVDILYVQLAERRKLWLDILGTVFFLIPSMLVAAWFAWPFFMQSWNVQEMSMNAGGLIRWPVKLILPVGFTLVALQGLSEIIKRAAALRGEVGFQSTYERPVQ
ncbi:MAG TPA: TRAP transporter small permease subunit [Casimicrobiaceae bacterium]|nr:TRAP transporter small permease subunit [Casimicrobiaceae bacterium]